MINPGYISWDRMAPFTRFFISAHPSLWLYLLVMPKNNTLEVSRKRMQRFQMSRVKLDTVLAFVEFVEIRSLTTTIS